MEAMKQYDTNKDGKLSREEAEPMMNSAFETLKSLGKLPPEMEDWQTAFNGGFELLHTDKSGYLEVNEIKRLAKFLLNSIRKDSDTRIVGP